MFESMCRKKLHNTRIKTFKFIYVEKEFTIAPLMTNEKGKMFT